MIYEGSRYDDEKVVQVQDSAGALHSAIYISPLVDRRYFEFVPYTVADGDRMDVLAYRFYGDADMWWLIARANPEAFYPGNLSYGTVIRIPYALS